MHTPSLHVTCLSPLQVMMALEEERRMPLSRGEGPFGLIICTLRMLEP